MISSEITIIIHRKHRETFSLNCGFSKDTSKLSIMAAEQHQSSTLIITHHLRSRPRKTTHNRNDSCTLFVALFSAISKVRPAETALLFRAQVAGVVVWVLFGAVRGVEVREVAPEWCRSESSESESLGMELSAPESSGTEYPGPEYDDEDDESKSLELPKLNWCMNANKQGCD